MDYLNKFFDFEKFWIRMNEMDFEGSFSLEWNIVLIDCLDPFREIVILHWNGRSRCRADGRLRLGLIASLAIAALIITALVIRSLIPLAVLRLTTLGITASAAEEFNTVRYHLSHIYRLIIFIYIRSGLNSTLNGCLTSL